MAYTFVGEISIWSCFDLRRGKWRFDKGSRGMKLKEGESEEEERRGKRREPVRDYVCIPTVPCGLVPQRLLVTQPANHLTATLAGGV